MANANGIAGLAITLLLGSSVVFGSQIECPQLQEITRKLYGFDSGTLSPIEYSKFDNPITFERAQRHSEHDRNVANAYAVEQSDQELPEITVDGESYKLFTFATRPFDIDQGTANLIIIFSADGYKTPHKAVFIYVPILLSDTDDADLNKQLTEDLSSLSNLPLAAKGYYTVTSVQWLKPHLEKAIRVNIPSLQRKRPSSQKQAVQYSLPKAMYMTDCETVSTDYIVFQPVDERPAP